MDYELELAKYFDAHNIIYLLFILKEKKYQSRLLWIESLFLLILNASMLLIHNNKNNNNNKVILDALCLIDLIFPSLICLLKP